MSFWSKHTSNIFFGKRIGASEHDNGMTIAVASALLGGEMGYQMISSLHLYPATNEKDLQSLLAKVWQIDKWFQNFGQEHRMAS